MKLVSIVNQFVSILYSLAIIFMNNLFYPQIKFMIKSYVAKVGLGIVLFLCVFFSNSYSQKQDILNPICSGYYADPTIIKYRDTFYIYATVDPWGGKELGVILTKDIDGLGFDRSGNILRIEARGISALSGYNPK